MTPTKNQKFNIYQLLQEMKKIPPKKEVSFEELEAKLQDKGRILVIMFLSLLFVTPLQIPGLSTIFGLLISYLSMKNLFRLKSKQIPKWLNYKIPFNRFEKLIQKAETILLYLQKWVHPRWMIFFRPKLEPCIHLVLLISGLILALPLPIPFSNILIGWAILLICFGFLEEDGLLIFLGYLLKLTAALYLLLPWLLYKNHFS